MGKSGIFFQNEVYDLICFYILFDIQSYYFFGFAISYVWFVLLRNKAANLFQMLMLLFYCIAPYDVIIRQSNSIE